MTAFKAQIDTANKESEELDIKARVTSIKRNFLDLVQYDQYVGEVYSLGYETALVMIHDHHRRVVGGIPSLSFLIATRIPRSLTNSKNDPELDDFDYKREDSSILLLRVMDAARLPSDDEAIRIRVQSAQNISGEPSLHWDSTHAMDSKTHHVLSFAGVQCRVIGTFYLDNLENNPIPELNFGSDISNYYPNQGLKVYKPNQKALEAIVNYRTGNDGTPPVMIGQVRYASTHRNFQGIAEVPFSINPADLLDQKTALFGMTRTGKSNTTKIILTSVFGLRLLEKDYANVRNNKPKKIGQIVFDPNGEYANENDQNVALTNLGEDVVVYGIVRPEHDRKRSLIRLNFLEERNLQDGKDIIDAFLAPIDTIYVKAFRQVKFMKPDDQDHSAITRYKRRVLAYRSLLVRGGFVPPDNDLMMRRTHKLFNPELLKAMRDSTGNNASDYKQAAAHFESSSPTWDQLFTSFDALYKFMNDKYSGYNGFEDWYINKRDKASGEKWADSDFTKILEMISRPGGVKQIGDVSEQHTNDVSSDYSTDIYKHLTDGKLVIVDQSLGNPQVNKSAADRIMWAIFRGNQTVFRRGIRGDDFPQILVYVEEAHTILPSSSEADYQDIWVRTAKEGAKYHIGMVYITQEVSSIQRNILKNTANWFIGHLNNTDETKELRKFYDFADFEGSILRAQDKGFLRVKTMSNPFVVPIQVKRFLIERK